MNSKNSFKTEKKEISLGNVEASLIQTLHSIGGVPSHKNIRIVKVGDLDLRLGAENTVPIEFITWGEKEQEEALIVHDG